MIALLACTGPVTCGPGTILRDQACEVPREADGDADTSAAATTDTSADTSSPGGDVSVLDVYVLAGQSNMDGYGYYTGLPPSWLTADPRVPLFWSGWGEFRDLQAASYGGQAYAGPEVGLGRTLAGAGRRVALVKHAVGGTDLAFYWYAGDTPGDSSAGDGFRALVSTMAAAEVSLDTSGVSWRWAGLVWMQGESDALDLGMANRYEVNLAHLVASMRELTGEPELHAYVGLISREAIWTYADMVRDAQQAVADGDPLVVTVETDDLPRNPLDTAHYEGTSNRVLGQRFATAVLTGADVPEGPDAPEPVVTVSSYRTDYDFTGTCGWSFSLEEPRVVTDVGNFGSTYVYTSADLGIWDATGNLVLRANVPGWYDAPTTPRGAFWYTAVDPVQLDAGEYRVGLVSWTGDADRYANDAGATLASGFAYGEGVYAEGYWLTYPSNTVATSAMSFLGPNFMTVPAM